jgi:hypothetical protein
MSERRSLHDRLFRAVVVMGAALGTSACYERGQSPPSPPDARVADAPKGGLDAPADVILII